MRNIVDLKSHIEQEHKGYYLILMQLGSLLTIYYFDSSVEKVDIKVCDYCKLIVAGVDELRCHKRIAHGARDVARPTCSKCLVKPGNWANFQLHIYGRCKILLPGNCSQITVLKSYML
jgi:hypothetical protein